MNAGGEGGTVTVEIPGGGAGGAENDDPIWSAPEFCFTDQAIEPMCYTRPGGSTPILLKNPRHIAMNTTSTWGGWHVVVSERGGHTMRVIWGSDTGDLGWACFDTVPYANRVAGTSLTNDYGEWFVTTDCGQLYARRYGLFLETDVWSPWSPFTLPTARSFALDVATSISPDAINYVFISDRGRVFQRHRIGTEAASFSAWQEVPTPTTERLAAGLRPDGRQQLFVLDQEGEPFTCIQTSIELGADFEECVDFDGADVPELIEIAAPYRVPEGSPLVAVDRDGALWTRFQDGVGGFDAWQPFPVAAPEPFLSISGGGLLDEESLPLSVAGITRGGNVYMIGRRDGVWGTWTIRP